MAWGWYVPNARCQLARYGDVVVSPFRGHKNEAQAVSVDFRIEVVPPTELPALLPLVYRTWLTSYRPFARAVMWNEVGAEDARWRRQRGDAPAWMPKAERVANEAYWSGQHALIEHIIRRGATMRVVLDPEAPVAWAWAVSEGPLLHYVFTKSPFRRQGFAARLLHACQASEYTHWTAEGAALMDARFPALRYNPYGAACGPLKERHVERAAATG